MREHPLREHLRALQLVALYRAGRQTDALAAYRDARSLLTEELGLEPSEELQRLERQILTHDPALDPSVPAPVAEPPAEDEREPDAGFEEERKLVTILYYDVATEAALEAIRDPEDLRPLQARAEQVVAAAVDRHGGTLVRSAGGEGTVVFGVPAIHEDDALRAVRAADEIRGASSALGLGARIGVDSGEVIVDGPASVTGVAVAVAKRLAEAAPARRGADRLPDARADDAARSTSRTCRRSRSAVGRRRSARSVCCACTRSWSRSGGCSSSAGRARWPHPRRVGPRDRRPGAASSSP